MSEYVLRPAQRDDLPAVMALLGEAAAWLAGRRIVQWPANGFPRSRIAGGVGRGTVYLLTTTKNVPAATVTVDAAADPEFWVDDRDALYVHKLATGRAFAGQGLGAHLLDWAGDLADSDGRHWLRLDCAKQNPGLQDFYRRQGFAHLRTVDLPHRASGALFQRPARRKVAALA
jgi:ribosomal protein S18 acetylase RimI-like enzyme